MNGHHDFAEHRFVGSAWEFLSLMVAFGNIMLSISPAFRNVLLIFLMCFTYYAAVELIITVHIGHLSGQNASMAGQTMFVLTN